MLSRFLFLAGFLLYTSQSLGQAFEPGLLVRSNGDTLRGELENGFWQEPPTYIRFRHTATSPVELFKPRQLQAVSFTGGRYFRYEILPIDHAAKTKVSDLQEGNLTDIQVDSLLAEVLLDGPVPLLRVVGFGTVHYLFRRPNQPILDVCERKYLRRGLRGSLLLADGNNYRAQLGRYFGDCPAAGAAAETIPFTAAGLVTVVQAYNETCTPGRQQAHSWLAQASPRRRVALQGGVLTGMRYSRYESSTPFTGLGFDSQLHPFAGLYADLFQPNRTTAIYGELTMSAFRSRVTNYYGPSFNYRALLGTARLGVRLFFPRPHEQYWLVGFGLELNKVINPTITTQLSPLASFPNKELRYASPTLFPNVGLGWRYRHITLSLDGQLYIDHTDNLGFEAAFFSENIATRLSVGYRLGHNPDLVAKRP